MLWKRAYGKKLKTVFYFFVFLTVFMPFYFHYKDWTPTSKDTPVKKIDAEQRQVARRKIMKQYCAKHLSLSKPPKDLTRMHHIIVDDINKIIYCSIPKVSSTTWKRLLLDLRGEKRGVYIHRKSLFKRLYQYTEEEREKRLRTYFKFLFVREPLHRLLSAFKNKFIGDDQIVSEKARVEIIKAYRPEDLNNATLKNQVSFAEFIKYFSYDRERDKHWLQYERLSFPCLVNYDFLGQFETLADDAALVLKLAGIDDRVTFPPVHGSTSSSEVLQYYSQVPPEDILRIGEQYRVDFEMFGYDFLAEVKPLLNISLDRNQFKQAVTTQVMS